MGVVVRHGGGGFGDGGAMVGVWDGMGDGREENKGKGWAY